MLRTYDPKEISMIVGGKIISGYADGSFLTVERNNPSWNLQIGSDGEAVRAKSNDKSGKFTITLQQGSPLNADLAAFAKSDEVNGGGVFSVLIKDNNGTSLHSAETAWIVQPSTSEYARENGSREWVIETDNLESMPGGNSVTVAQGA